MTECERIINSNILKREFFNEEIMDDFLVTEKRKKIWAVELDLLLAIDAVCRKYDLHYYLFWGSLLGAVRHKGFIPWDDDTDIVLTRGDYEKLLKHKDEFEDPYFFQTPYTDDGYYYSHAKLRNSNTSAIDYPFLYQGFNLGIFVDILPLDLIEESDNGKERFKRIAELNVLNSTAMRLSNPNLTEKDRNRVEAYPGGNPFERYEEIQKLSKYDNGLDSRRVSVFAATVYGFERDVFFREDFADSVYADFLGYCFPIPIGYDRILRTAYGNYTDLPPIETRGQWHGNVKFFPDIPYKHKVQEIIRGGK